MNKASEYENIINLPHHVSDTHPRMSSRDRAAQFAPFAALTGFGAEVKETERLTAEKPELDEYRASRLDACLQILSDNAAAHPDITVTFFVADKRKSGGSLVTADGSFRRLDESVGSLVLTDGRSIPLDDICSIDGEIFHLIDE